MDRGGAVVDNSGLFALPPKDRISAPPPGVPLQCTDCSSYMLRENSVYSIRYSYFLLINVVKKQWFKLLFFPPCYYYNYWSRWSLTLSDLSVCFYFRSRFHKDRLCLIFQNTHHAQCEQMHIKICSEPKWIT